MQEVLKKVASNSIEPVDKTVTLCIRSQRFKLNGVWNWEMISPAVYCSDVMFFPDEFIGTKCLIHPDDLPKLNSALSLLEEKEIPRLDFRVITTYGEVKTISGQRVSLEDEKNKTVELIPGKEPWEEALQLLAAQRENDFLRLRHELSEYTERLHGIGSWMINRQTGQAWFSDNVYRIYGLAPQSLNAHANTFNQFIHKDDRVAVLDAFEKAYLEQAPLHIEYRIVSADGETRYVQQMTKWLYTANGQDIFAGIIRNVTEERTIVDDLLRSQTQVSLHHQVLKIAEQQTTTGYWLIDLATRKTSYSENYYRIYGFKQQFLPSYNSFINLVHADDRAKVKEHVERMYNEHALSEIEFRIIRPDGKQRYIKQSGKIFVSPNKELIMIGLVQDVTVQKGLEKKILELNEDISLSKAVMEMTENALESSSFIWLPDGYMQWSDGFYRLLGYKPGSIEALPRFLYKNIHPADLKIFRDAETVLLNHQSHDDIIIRMVSKGGIRKVRISFRQVNYGKDATIALVHDFSKQSELSEQFASNKWFTDLLRDSVNDMILFTNLDNTILHWNKVAEEKTGIPKDNALYHNLFDVLPQLNEESFLGQIRFAGRGEETHSSRVREVYLKKPHHYWLWPLKNEAGEVVGVLHVIQDISKQLELQQQLNERLNFIESLVESSVDRIVVLDRFMNYIYWNKKAEEYYAISKERVIGKNILEVFPSFRSNASYNEFRRVLKGETVYLPPFENENNEYFETYLTPIKDDNGEVTAVLWIVHDLTREYQLTKERTQSSRLLQATMDSSTEMVQVFEAVRNEKGEIVDFRYILLNREAEKWMPDSIGKLLLQTQPGVVEEGIFDAFKEVVETGIPKQYEKRYVHEQFDGWFYQSVVKLDDGVATTTTDITERKKAEHEVLRLKDQNAQKATDKYRNLFNSMNEGFCIIEIMYDESGKAWNFRYVEVNPAFSKHTGVNIEYDKTVRDYAPEVTAEFIAIFAEVARTGNATEFSYFAETRGRWFHLNLSRFGSVELNQVAILFNDATEHKQREQEQQFLIKFSDTLRAEPDADAIANKAIQMLAEHLRLDRCYVGLALLDDNLAIFPYQFGNDRVPPMPEEGVPLSDFPDALRKTFDQTLVITDFQNTEGLTEREKQNFAALAFGALVVANVRKEVRNPDWSINAVSATPRQWTESEISLIEQVAERSWAAVERAKAEEALRNLSKSLEQQVKERLNEVKHSKDLLQYVFDASLDGIILFRTVRDSKGLIQDYEVVLNNLVTQNWNGRDLTGKLYSVEFPHIKKHGILDAFNKVMETGEPSKLEVKYEGDGFKNWFVITAIKVNEEELLSTAEDITERKNAEEELIRNLTILQYTEQLAQTGSWEYDIPTGNFTWSDGMYKLFGLPKQMRVQPEIYLDHATDEDRTVAKRIVNNLRKKHHAFEETMRINKAGDQRLLAIKASVVYNDKKEAQKIIGVDIDITDIQKTKEKLKESQHWLEQTAKASPDSITIYDLNQKQPVYLNNCLSEWTGVSNDELIDMGIEGRLKIIHEDDRLKLLHFNEKIAATEDGKVLTIDYRIKSTDDRLIWIRNRSKVFLRDKEGKVTHILSILQNVTEEVELQRELKLRTQYAEAIIDGSIDRIAVYDKQLRIIAWNKRAEETTGRKRQNVLGQKLFDVFPRVAQDEELLKAHLDALEGNYVSVPAKKGVYTNSYYERFYIPLKNSEGEVYALVSIMHDVSDMVNRNRELKELNESLEQKNAELEQKNEEITSFAFVASHDMKEPLRKIHTFSDWLLEQETANFSPKGKSLVEKINSSVNRMEALIEDILVLTKIHSDTHKTDEVDLNRVMHSVLDDMEQDIAEKAATVQTETLPVIKANANQLFYLFKNLMSNAIKFQKPGNLPHIKVTSEIVRSEELNIPNPHEAYVKISFADNGFGFDKRYAKKIFQVFQRLHGKHEFEGT